MLETRAAGMPLGAYIKAQVFHEQGGRNRPAAPRRMTDTKALAQALALLGQSRIASNLNQLARAAHIGALPIPSRLERDLDEACAHVAAIRAVLIEALGLKNGRA